MSLTFTSFLTACVSSSLLILFLAKLVISPSPKACSISPEVALICVVLVVLRALLPYEFFYTRTIKSLTFMPLLMSVGKIHIVNQYFNIKIIQLLFAMWIMVAGIKLVILINKQYNVENIINSLPSSKRTHIMQAILDNMGIDKKIKLIEIPGLVSPALIGLKDPKIIIPKNISDDDLYYVLLHELEHYKKHDLIFIYALHILCIIYWWNPLIYLLKSVSIRLIEYRIDEKVLGKLDNNEKVDYLQSIVNVVKQKCDEHMRVELSVGFYEKSTSLSSRFINIVNSTSKTKSRLCLCTVLFLVFISTSLIAEPYTISDRYEENTFALTDNSYLVENNGLYDLYIDGAYKFTIDSKDGFNQLPIMYN